MTKPGGASSLVVDASALIDFLLRQPLARRLRKAMFAETVRLHAPDLIDAELLMVLRRCERSGELGALRADELQEDFRQLPIELHALRPHYDRVWSVRNTITVNDAYYVSLAEAIGAPLLTTDNRLARGLAALGTVSVVDLAD
ncbi:MAG: type II toxin-antitoxin system VapC family toxin [Sciscionella sp.]|nr:type II toxin-antitoxin system VapC family toxin [Sciscionella sp.]